MDPAFRIGGLRLRRVQLRDGAELVIDRGMTGGAKRRRTELREAQQRLNQRRCEVRLNNRSTVKTPIQVRIPLASAVNPGTARRPHSEIQPPRCCDASVAERDREFESTSLQQRVLRTIGPSAVAPVQSTRGAGLLFLWRTNGVYAWSCDHRRQLRRLSQPTEVRSRPCGSVPLPVQAKRGLSGLLHRDLLSPRAHERGGPRIACVALERIAPEEGPSATDTDRLLGDRDDRALHGLPTNQRPVPVHTAVRLCAGLAANWCSAMISSPARSGMPEHFGRRITDAAKDPPHRADRPPVRDRDLMP